MFYVLGDIHSYRFKTSKTTPCHTTFVNSEEFAKLNNVLMRFMPVKKMIYQFGEAFKPRVESVKWTAGISEHDA
jgi:hypothetical protein